MTRKTASTLIVSIAFVLGIATPGRAGIIQTLTVTSSDNASGTTTYFDSADGYDFSSSFPTPGATTTIGTFAFTIPANNIVTGITLSGAFGNIDGTTTALSDYYLGSAGNETNVDVANCDSVSVNCYSGQEGPYAWSATLTQAQIASLASALTAGSLDFSYTWDSGTPPVADGLSQTGYDQQYVYAGAPTINIQLTQTPEPATVLICLSGLAGIAALRRLRKVQTRF